MKKIWKWLDNFWYHNKWKTIIIAFFVIVFIIGFVQCMKKTDADISILYVGPEVVTGEEYDAMETSLESRVDTDYNGDGKITGVVIGAVMIALIDNAIPMLGIGNSMITEFVKGILLLFAILLNVILQRMANKQDLARRNI